MNIEFFKRRKWFDEQWPIFLNSISSLSFPVLHTCPCCGYPTIKKRCWWEICLICWWEDDGQDDTNADKESISGANHRDDLDKPCYTLNEARTNFKKHGIMFDLKDGRFQRIGNPNKTERIELVKAFNTILNENSSNKNQDEILETIKFILKSSIHLSDGLK